ncbi:ATP/GTP-binding protein [Streptomyces sp. NPDC059371]|uniref:ATP/GTP-binding protein n=1 Tax=Streptomyces sp. NPDC059371 TaxID=3346812 RepID=UPI0036AD512B
MTKVLLLVIFVIGLIAQFVKPVGDAFEGKAYLGGALLSLVGYVLYAEVQRLNTAHEAQREGTGALHIVARHLQEEVQRLNEEVRHLHEERLSRVQDLVTPDDLKAEFEKALEAGGNVRFSAMGFTGETFARPLERILEAIPENLERTLQLRVLVPDFTKPLEVPGLVGADGKVRDAPAFRQSLVQQIEGYEALLKRQVARMRHKHQGELTVEFRVMHMSPSLKLYFINDDQVFEGIYDKIELRQGEYDSGIRTGREGESDGGQILDLLGFDSLLTRWSWDDDQRSRDVIVRRQKLFNTFWEAAHDLSEISGRSVR